MGCEREIEESIQILAKTFNKDNKDFVFCEVTAVSKEDRTCDAIPISGDNETAFEGILLSAEPNDGVIKIPAIGSTVLVIFGNRDAAYVLMFSDIDEYIATIKDGADEIEFSITKDGIFLNGDNEDGLPKVNSLVDKISALENDLNALKQIFLSTWIVAPGDGGGALKLAAATWAGDAFTPTVKADLENPKVKQGG